MKRKRKLDPKIIRVGDQVKIIIPDFFEACRYDNNIITKTEEVVEQHGKEIRDFIHKMTVGGSVPVLFGYLIPMSVKSENYPYKKEEK